MKNLQSRLGKEDGAWLRREHPQADLRELIKIASERDRMAGVGMTQATLSGPGPDLVALKICNPAVKGNKGAAKAFLFAWWAGVISSFLGRDFDYANVSYDESENTIECEIVPRRTV